MPLLIWALIEDNLSSVHKIAILHTSAEYINYSSCIQLTISCVIHTPIKHYSSVKQTHIYLLESFLQNGFVLLICGIMSSKTTGLGNKHRPHIYEQEIATGSTFIFYPVVIFRWNQQEAHLSSVLRSEDQIYSFASQMQSHKVLVSLLVSKMILRRLK